MRRRDLWEHRLTPRWTCLATESGRATATTTGSTLRQPLRRGWPQKNGEERNRGQVKKWKVSWVLVMMMMMMMMMTRIVYHFLSFAFLLIRSWGGGFVKWVLLSILTRSCFFYVHHSPHHAMLWEYSLTLTIKKKNQGTIRELTYPPTWPAHFSRWFSFSRGIWTRSLEGNYKFLPWIRVEVGFFKHRRFHLSCISVGFPPLFDPRWHIKHFHSDFPRFHRFS